MKVSVTVHEITVDQSNAINAMLANWGAGTPATMETKTAAKRGRPAKEETEETDAGFETEEVATKAQVITALRKYADENDKKAAMKILTKFKVKSVNDLDPEDYAAVIEATEG